MKLLKIIFTLAALIGATVSQAAIGATAVWRVGQAATSANGGGFYTSGGTDYSNQDAPQYALTGIATAGAGATFLYASASSDMVGNGLCVVSGTNFTTGRYEVISVSVGVSVTCDASICTGVGANGVINIGGRCQSLMVLASASANQGMTPGNIAYVAFSNGTGTITQGANLTWSVPGTTANPIQTIGINSAVNDLINQGRNANGTLNTTNFPIIAFSSTFRFNGAAATAYTMNNLIVTGTVSNILFEQGVNAVLRQCSVTNTSSNSSARVVVAGVSDNFLTCDFTSTGTNGTDVCASGQSLLVYDCRITGPTVCMNADGGDTTVQCSVMYPSVARGTAGTVGIKHGNSSTGRISKDINNTIDGFENGITFGNFAYLDQMLVMNNIITNCTTDVNNLRSGTANMCICAPYNRLRGNTNSFTGYGPWHAATNWGEVTTAGADSADFVDATNHDYHLVSGSPAYGAGLPKNTNIGAYPRQQVVTSSTN